MTDYRKAIDRQGWRQGAFFKTDDHNELKKHLRSPITDNDRCLVVSHDCDILHGSIDNEPIVEVLITRPLGQAENLNLNSHNPRILHLKQLITNQQLPYEILIRNRAMVPRKLLADLTPDSSSTLDPEALRIIRTWLGNRYTRTAMPTALDKRLRQINKFERKLKKALAGTEFHSLRMKIQPLDELVDPEDYRLELRGIVETPIWEDTERRTVHAQALHKFAKLLEKAAGVIIDSERIRPTNQFTLDEAYDFPVWNLDYLSLGDEPIGSVPEE